MPLLMLFLDGALIVSAAGFGFQERIALGVSILAVAVLLAGDPRRCDEAQGAVATDDDLYSAAPLCPSDSAKLLSLSLHRLRSRPTNR